MIELKRKINKFSIMIRDIKHFLIFDRTFRKKIFKDMRILITIHQENLIDIYKTLHPKPAQYTFLSMSTEYMPR